jgi:hypothetical protein
LYIQPLDVGTTKFCSDYLSSSSFTRDQKILDKHQFALEKQKVQVHVSEVGTTHSSCDYPLMQQQLVTQMPLLMLTHLLLLKQMSLLRLQLQLCPTFTATVTSTAVGMTAPSISPWTADSFGLER